MKQESSAKSAVRLMSGAGISCVITLVAAPILARIYGPESYGGWATIFSTVSLLSVIGCLRYEVLIPLIEKEEDALGVVLACFLGVAITSLVIFALIGSPLYGNQLLKDGIYQWRYWIVPAVALNALFLCGVMWSTRQKSFTLSAKSRVTSVTVQNAASIFGGLIGWASALGLIGGYLIGRVAGVAMLFTGLFSGSASGLLRGVSFMSTLRIMRDNWRFPIINIWTPILSQASLQMPVFLLAALHGPIVVGLYAFGARIAEVPSALIAQSLGQVFYRRAAELQTSGGLGDALCNFVKQLIFLACPIYGAMIVVSPNVFALFFGQEWREAGVYLSILGCLRIAVFVLSPINGLFNILGKHVASVLFNALFMVVSVIGILLGSLVGPRFAIALYSFGGLLILFSMVGFLLRSSGAAVGTLVRAVIYPVSAWVILVIALLAHANQSRESSGITLIGLAIGISIHLFWYCRCHPSLVQMAKTLCKRKG